MPAHLHILSFNVPYPPDYGGVIDVFAKIKALHAEGVQIHLHCFTYNRPEAKELESFCASVNYYPRHVGLKGISFTEPYIVSSRSSSALLKRLGEDNYPILAEGIHTSRPLLQKEWPGRNIGIRLHNVEADYYNHLEATEKNPIRRAYLRLESRLLAKWEAKVKDIPLLAIHPSIAEHFKKVCQNPHASYLPAFTPWEHGQNPGGRGTYVLFHGDLSVPDNVKSLEWLLEGVWAKGGPPWVVAGRRPGRRVLSLLRKFPSIRIECDPGPERMEELVRGAQIHLIHSFNPTGIKIKLLHALFQGRFCVAHSPLVTGLDLEETCHKANSAGEFKDAIQALWDRPFLDEDRNTRGRVLSNQFDNQVNARKLMEWMEAQPPA